MLLPIKRMAAKAADSSGELHDGGSSDPGSDARARPPAALLGSPCSSGAREPVRVDDIRDRHTDRVAPNRYSCQSARRRPAPLSIHQAAHRSPAPAATAGARSSVVSPSASPRSIRSWRTQCPAWSRRCPAPGDHSDRSAGAADQLHRSCLNSLVNPRRVCWTLSVFLSHEDILSSEASCLRGEIHLVAGAGLVAGVEGYEGAAP